MFRIKNSIIILFDLTNLFKKVKTEIHISDPWYRIDKRENKINRIIWKKNIPDNSNHDVIPVWEPRSNWSWTEHDATFFNGKQSDGAQARAICIWGIVTSFYMHNIQNDTHISHAIVFSLFSLTLIRYYYKY